MFLDEVIDGLIALGLPADQERAARLLVEEYGDDLERMGYDSGYSDGEFAGSSWDDE